MVAAAHTQTARSTTAETPDNATPDGRGSARSMSLAEYRERLHAIRARNGNVSSGKIARRTPLSLPSFKQTNIYSFYVWLRCFFYSLLRWLMSVDVLFC